MVIWKYDKKGIKRGGEWDKMFNLLLAIRASEFVKKYKHEATYRNCLEFSKTYYGQVARVIIIKERTKNYKVIWLPAINQQKTATIKKFNYHHEIVEYINSKIK